MTNERKCHLCDTPTVDKYCENTSCEVNRRDENLSMCDNCDTELPANDMVQTIEDEILCDPCYTKWEIKENCPYCTGTPCEDHTV